uniref:Photosystem I reaction center subunit XII n=1 Tax=Caulerpa verticillata TaxID=177082 RepID=A0A386B0G3_9CHLO|nr:photosystem I reaction center subunit M [Caulerpa verticillata]AYC65181.1 photosystem I reaction center subunit M [Caulerpa verticillata]
MSISESQIFIALFCALINGFLALRLGSSLYRN